MASEPGKPSTAFWIVVAALMLAGGLWWFGGSGSGGTVNVMLPELSRVAQAGREVFAENCAACHGDLGGGTGQGPPLVHKIYEPSHHADASFVLAAKRGVSQHHWSFGNMPPQPQVGERAMQQISPSCASCRLRTASERPSPSRLKTRT